MQESIFNQVAKLVEILIVLLLCFSVALGWDENLHTRQDSFSPPVGEICFMASAKGETMLEFIQLKDGPVFTGKGMTVSFKYEGALTQLREKAIAMGYVLSELRVGGPAPDNFTVTDPAGIEVEFCN